MSHQDIKLEKRKKGNEKVITCADQQKKTLENKEEDDDLVCKSKRNGSEVRKRWQFKHENKSFCILSWTQCNVFEKAYQHTHVLLVVTMFIVLVKIVSNNKADYTLCCMGFIIIIYYCCCSFNSFLVEIVFDHETLQNENNKISFCFSRKRNEKPKKEYKKMPETTTTTAMK